MSRRRRGFLLHLHPPSVPEGALRLSRTWGLGGLALTAFLLLAATGGLLMLVYEPTPEGAYPSVLVLWDRVSFGRWVRNTHHWSANLMLLVSALHLLRVVLTGGHLGPRRGNWLIGLGLLACVVGAVFTGYLLPWDQLSYWAVTICIGMLEYLPVVGLPLQQMVRGGDQIGAGTLQNFFTLHTSLLPGALVVLMGFHFWKVRRARGVILPRSSGDGSDSRRLPVRPHLVVREAAAALVLLSAVLWFSVFVDAPLAAPANPGMSPNPAKAPWYFLGFQELLIHLHPLFAVAVLPALATAALAALPYLPRCESHPGRWFVSPRGRRLALGACVCGTAVTALAIVIDERIYRGGAALGALPAVVAGGLAPTLGILSALVGVAWWLRRRLGASDHETVQTLFVLLCTAFLVCTAAGIWFRGPGMALVWPWGGTP